MDVPTIASFKLTRGKRQTEAPTNFRFLSKWVDSTALARGTQSFYTDDADDFSLSFTYSMNVALKTMVIFGAFLVNTINGERKTKMRCWQMIVDSWRAGGGSQPAGTNADLKYLAFNEVIEEESMKAMEAEIAQRLSAEAAVRLPELTLDILPSSPNWKANPWLRVADHVAQAVGKSASVAHIVVDGNSDFHLVVELI